MNLFRVGNPMNESWTGTRKLSLVFYVLFFLLSAWVTSESLVRTFKTSPMGNSQLAVRIFWFVAAIMILVLASFCLKMVRKSFEGKVSNRLFSLLVGGAVFLIAWFFILMANTHGIYYLMTTDKQRKSEMRAVKNQIESVQTSSVTAFQVARKRFEEEINADIKNMKDEINNRNNPGRGEETNKIVNEISKKVGEIRMPTNAPISVSGRAQYADDLAKKIIEIRDTKLSVVDTKIRELDNFLKQKDYQNTLDSLDNLITSYDVKTEKELTDGLSNSYSFYEKTYAFVKDLFKEPLIVKYVEFPFQPLPSVPVSIASEDIAYVWGEYFGGTNINLVLFRWAILLGFMFDLACYVIWYFGVLPEDE